MKTKNFFLGILSIITLSSCSITNYLSDTQMSEAVQADFYVAQAEKQPNTFVALVRRPDLSSYADMYIFRIENIDSTLIKEEYYDATYFNYGAAYLHMWPSEQKYQSDTVRIILAQHYSKQNKKWAKQYIKQEIAVISRQ